jgi:hypothetical protein
MRQEILGPGIHGPSLRWYKPSGFIALCLRSAWRFWITGRPVWGRGDNATLFHDATVDHRGGPVERLNPARWRVVAWRWGLAGVPWLLADAAYWIGWWPLLAYAALAVGVAGWLAWRAVATWWPARHVRREFVFPTWAVVARVVGERPNRRAAVRAIILPDGFGIEDDDQEGAELSVRIHLPAVPLDDGIKKRLAAAAGERLGMPDPAASWMVKGSRAYVDLAPRVFPPRKLTYAEVRAAVLAAPPERPLVGLAAGRKPVYADLDNDGPHIGVSGGTGTGKSTLLKIILARRVHAGVGLVVCDYKVTSHRWARRIAQQDPHRVLYVTDEEEISDAILAVFAEFCRRRELLKTDPDALATFRPVDLLVEELNSLASMLRKWWGHERRRIIAEAKDLGEPVPYVPVVPPAVDALAALVQMGRELKIHNHFAAQRLDASALSPKDGGAVRESITNRFLSKYTKAVWQMLCAGVPFEAFPGGPRGIWTAVVNGEVTHFRVPHMGDGDAYDLAMSGQAPVGPVLGGRLAAGGHREIERAVTLGEAWELIGAPSLPALQKAVQRAELTPVGRRGNALTYDVRELEGVLGKR